LIIKYRKLGNTGLIVSELALGTMQFGSKMNIGNLGQENASRMVKLALDHGINFIDTADVYSLRHPDSLSDNRLKKRCQPSLKLKPLVGPGAILPVTSGAIVAMLDGINYMKKDGIQLMTIVILDAACFLASCAVHNSTAIKSSLSAGFVAPNSSAKYDAPPDDPATAEDYWLPPGRAEGQPYYRPR
jgi:Aldo/keto reductase family